MVPHVKKLSLIAATFLVALFAVFALLQLARVSAAEVPEARGAEPASSPQQVDVESPGVGGWILVANHVTSNLSIVNTADDVVYGPLLEGQLGSAGGRRLDIAVTPDGKTALISNGGDRAVFFVDVSDPIHPSLITSVTIPFFAEDIDISPDGKYALVTDAAPSSRIASINILSATLVYTADLGSAQAQAVEIAPDGTVIVAGYLNRAVHTLLLDQMGVLTYANTYTYTYPGYAITDTNGLPYPINIGLAPDGQTIIVCSTSTSTIGVYRIVAPGVLTFTGVVTGLHGTFPIDANFKPGVQSVAFNAAGSKAYAVVNRYIYSATVYQDRLAVLNIAGPGQVSLEAGGVVTVPHTTSSLFFGVDTVAVAGNKVYLGYPTSLTDDDPTNLAIVDLTDYSVTTTLVLSKAVFLPAGVAAIPLRQVHLPLVIGGGPTGPAPDLVVERIIAATDTIVVVIKNQGNAPVTDEFRVDVYINPDPVPTAVNQTWDHLCDEGLVWGVEGGALPLEPGERLALTVDDAYYRSSLSHISWPLAAGTPVYAQVDSANAGVWYGAVLETHEISGGAYNNIASTVSVAGSAR